MLCAALLLKLGVDAEAVGPACNTLQGITHQYEENKKIFSSKDLYIFFKEKL